MKRLNLTKFGFVRWPEEDFSDDGSHFTCYRAGNRVRVSKLISNGRVYLSIDSEVGNGTLPHEIYQKLPHYRDAEWKWNGVSFEDLTEQDVRDFYEACLAYEREYEEAEKTTVFPTQAEIETRCKIIKTIRAAEVEKINKFISDNIQRLLVTANQYTWSEIQRIYKNLLAESDKYEPNKIRKSESIRFCSDQCRQLSPSWWYERLVELIME
jgi:hypothetical protein